MVLVVKTKAKALYDNLESDVCYTWLRNFGHFKFAPLINII